MSRSGTMFATCLWTACFAQHGHGETLFEDSAIVPLPANHTHRGITGSILELRDGRLLFVYTFVWRGGDEDELLREHPDGGIAGRTSADAGGTWSKPFLVQPRIGTGATQSPSLLRLANGNVLLAYDVQNKAPTGGLREGGDQHMYVRISSDECRRWGEQLCATFTPGTCHAMPDRLVQTSSGRVILPVESGTPVKNERWVSFCYYSDNDGYSWWPSTSFVDLGGPRNSGTEEPVVVELKHGRLMMACRSHVGYLVRSYSTDQGESWSTPQYIRDLPSAVLAPHTMARIPGTGHLLMVWCNNPRGPELARGEEQPVVQVAQLERKLGAVRAPLSAAVSADEGKTWQHHRDITRDPEGVYGDYGYPCVTFVQAGQIALMNYNAVDGIHLARIGVDWFYGR